MKVISACAIIAWCMGIHASMAQDNIPDIQTDRPDETESSSVVPLGSLQLEAGFVYEDEKRDMETYIHVHRAYATPTVLARYGLLEWLELRAAGEHLLYMLQEYDLPPDTEGEYDNQFAWSVGTKVQLLREAGSIPEAALIADVTMPDGGGTAIPGFRLTLSHTLAPGLGFGYNLGGEFNMDAESFSDGFTGIYTAALGFDATESLGCFLEIFGSVHDNADPEHSFDGGITWLLSPNLQLDAAAGFGISMSAPNYFVNTGISVRVP